jgi:hypothetical protein
MRATNREAKLYQLNLEGGADQVATKPRDNEEEREQTALFDLREARVERYPDLAFLYATLNGVFIPTALKSRISRAGLTAGVPDLWLPLSRDPWKGLVIDLKSHTGRPTREQRTWMERLIKEGWRGYFCGGVENWLSPCEEAWYCICAYLEISGEPAQLSNNELWQLEQKRAAMRLAKR